MGSKIVKKQIAKRYAELEKLIEEHKDEFDPANNRNMYICPKGHTTITKDVDWGVTPFLHICSECGDFGRSSMYQLAPIHYTMDVQIEWYRPTLEECYKLKNKPEILDHILQGGLMDRKLKK